MRFRGRRRKSPEGTSEGTVPFSERTETTDVSAPR
jgi:hypothetical protein